jgi:hypothetical protein
MAAIQTRHRMWSSSAIDLDMGSFKWDSDHRVEVVVVYLFTGPEKPKVNKLDPLYVYFKLISRNGMLQDSHQVILVAGRLKIEPFNNGMSTSRVDEYIEERVSGTMSCLDLQDLVSQKGDFRFQVGPNPALNFDKGERAKFREFLHYLAPTSRAEGSGFDASKRVRRTYS